MSDWLGLLKKRIEETGAKTVARELCVSDTTVSLVLAGKYSASTHKIERKVLAIYGAGSITCPVLGEIGPSTCGEHYERYKKRLGASTKLTLMLRQACADCKVRE